MNSLENEAGKGRKRLMLWGVISIVLGMMAMLAPGITGLSIVFMLGLFILIAGGMVIRKLTEG